MFTSLLYKTFIKSNEPFLMLHYIIEPNIFVNCNRELSIVLKNPKIVFELQI